MKVFERPTSTDTRETVREAPERLPELPDGVTAPDDLRGLEVPASIGPTRPARGVRWLRWVPVVALLAIGAGFLVAALDDGGSDTAGVSTQVLPEFDSPGGNSLNIPTAEVTVLPEFDSPGGNSLNLTAAAVTVLPQFDSPGGNSLNTIAAVVTVLPEFDSPGGNSLNIP